MNPKNTRKELLIHQYAYYIMKYPFITDHEYDMLEIRYEIKTGKVLPIGSDLESSYPSWVKVEYKKRKGR